MMKSLIFLDYFTPAFKAGGPIRIFEAVARSCDAQNPVSIVTQNHDWGEAEPFPGIETNVWRSFDNARVLYADAESTTAKSLLRLLGEENPRVVHLNSLFSRVWTLKILLLRLCRLVDQGVVFYLSPHGELAPSALEIKRWRKAVFLRLGRLLGLFSGVRWLATSAKEVEEIRAFIGAEAPVLMIPPPFPDLVPHSRRSKTAGRARFVFLARISAMKNIGLIFNLLPGLKGDFEFHICGPVDPAFKDQWEALLSQASANDLQNKIVYRGPVESDRAREILAEYDFFVQPSLSENFGFSILEALAAGTPALISDRTPWNGITEAKAGAALPLDDRARWLTALQNFIDMDDLAWRPWSENAQKWVTENSTGTADLMRVYSPQTGRPSGS